MPVSLALAVITNYCTFLYDTSRKRKKRPRSQMVQKIP